MSETMTEKAVKMTESEWLALSDSKKNFWIWGQIAEKDPTKRQEIGDYLNWQGFGMIIDKMLSEGAFVTFRFSNNDKLRPWERAAIVYGEMKGLVE